MSSLYHITCCASVFIASKLMNDITQEATSKQNQLVMKQQQQLVSYYWPGTMKH